MDMTEKCRVGYRVGYRAGLGALLGALLGAQASGCVQHEDPIDYGDPTQISTPSTAGGITGYIAAPSITTPLAGPSVEVVVAAYTAGKAEPLTVQLGAHDQGLQPTRADGSPGPAQRFKGPVALVHGLNLVDVRAENADGSKFRRLDFSLVYSGDLPGVVFDVLASPGADATCDGAAPITGPVTGARAVCLRGRATAKPGSKVKTVQVSVGNAGGTAATLDDSGSFQGALVLGGSGPQTLSATVTDSVGGKTTQKLTIVVDATPPTLAITAPAAATTRTDDAEITLEGTAKDDQGLAEIRIESASGSVKSLGATSPWKGTIELTQGDNKLHVVAIDLAGNQASQDLVVTRSRVTTLRAPQTTQASTQLSLDRTALGTLLSTDDQKGIQLATVSLRPAIVAALEQIRDPDKYGVDTTTWGQAERNLSRLLDMTPDTANLKGTSVEELLTLATAVGLPPARVLSDLLDTPITDRFVGVDVVTDVIVSQLIATHPNATLDASGTPILQVSLYDVFQDLHTVGEKFGPTGAHPGFLSGTTEAKVLEPGFLMSIPVKTNLREYDGIDASGGTKSSIFLLQGDKVLELDFTSSAFSIVGLADEPAVDLRIAIKEDAGFLHAGKTKEARPDPMSPGFFRGDGEVWAIEPWKIENIVAETAYRQYAKLYSSSNYERTISYDTGSIKQAAVLGWSRGWVTMTTSGGIGDPPPPQYAWDILLETAQVRLHDGGIPEGMADMAFALKGLSIGLTADDLIAKVKPSLQMQAGKLSQLIAGTGGLADSGCDLFFAPATGGAAGFLFFRAAVDSMKTYAYARPGFFSDAALTQKASTPGALPGTTDTAHEKVAVSAGQKLYFQDDTGKPYLLEVVSLEPMGGGASVRVTAVGGGS
jgi:hypothetical protein